MNPAPMTISTAKKRRDELRARGLDIDARLAEMKRAFFVEKKEQDFGERVSLEAENAAIRVERNRVELFLHAAKKTEAAYRKASFTAILVRTLHEAGHAEIVKNAERQAMDEALALGMEAPQ